jgi:hypothetical protein
MGRTGIAEVLAAGWASAASARVGSLGGIVYGGVVSGERCKRESEVKKVGAGRKSTFLESGSSWGGKRAEARKVDTGYVTPSWEWVLAQ